jgi:hypothetical protein
MMCLAVFCRSWTSDCGPAPPAHSACTSRSGSGTPVPARPDQAVADDLSRLLGGPPPAFVVELLNANDPHATVVAQLPHVGDVLGNSMKPDRMGWEPPKLVDLRWGTAINPATERT